MTDTQQHRELLAMVAMHAIIAGRNEDGIILASAVARDAYKVADAMLMPCWNKEEK